jgi:hypothetical protein
MKKAPSDPSSVAHHRKNQLGAEVNLIEVASECKCFAQFPYFYGEARQSSEHAETATSCRLQTCCAGKIGTVRSW